MGSSQSSTKKDERSIDDNNNNIAVISDGIVEVKKKKEKRATNKHKKNSVEYQCRKQKRAWSHCVSNHYESKFLPGKALEPEEDCDDFFDNFRECYMKGILKTIKKNPEEGSLLHEFMVEEGISAANNNDDNSNNNNDGR